MKTITHTQTPIPAYPLSVLSAPQLRNKLPELLLAYEAVWFLATTNLLEDLLAFDSIIPPDYLEQLADASNLRSEFERLLDAYLLPFTSRQPHGMPFAVSSLLTWITMESNTFEWLRRLDSVIAYLREVN